MSDKSDDHIAFVMARIERSEIMSTAEISDSRIKRTRSGAAASDRKAIRHTCLAYAVARKTKSMPGLAT